jgi:hypothetical protein
MTARYRTLVALRLGWAATLLRYARRRAGGPDRRIEVISAHLLAARELVEALATTLDRDRRPPRWSSRLDALHATSMVPVALASPRLRRDAAASGSMAFVLSMLSR